MDILGPVQVGSSGWPGDVDGKAMGLPKVPYFCETNPVIAAQSSARTSLLASRLATRTDRDTLPGLPASRGCRTDSRSRVQEDASRKWLCEARERDVLGVCMCLSVGVGGPTGVGVARDQISPLGAAPLLRSPQVPRCIGARGTLRLWHLQTPDPLFLGR